MGDLLRVVRSGGDGAVEAGPKLGVFVEEFAGEAVGEFGEEGASVLELGLPVGGIHAEQFVQSFLRDF